MFKHWTIKLYTAMEHYGFKCFVHKMLLYVKTPSTPQNELRSSRPKVMLPEVMLPEIKVMLPEIHCHFARNSWSCRPRLNQSQPCEILCSRTFLTRLKLVFAFTWELMFWYLNISVSPKFLTWSYIIVGFFLGVLFLFF